MVDIPFSSEWKLLDVNILNTLILQRIVGLTEEQLSAENDERMPRKSTHFYPKPLSGLLFYPMRFAERNSSG
jgi:uncharacterized protein (DUF1015 family)